MPQRVDDDKECFSIKPPIMLLASSSIHLQSEANKKICPRLANCDDNCVLLYKNV